MSVLLPLLFAATYQRDEWLRHNRALIAEPLPGNGPTLAWLPANRFRAVRFRRLPRRGDRHGPELTAAPERSRNHPGRGLLRVAHG